MKVLSFLGIKAFAISLALMNEPLPTQLQCELNGIEGNLEDNVDFLLEIVEAYPPLSVLFRDVRVVEQMRSHQYELLVQQQTKLTGPLPSPDDWLRVASKAVKASDSVAEVKKLLETSPLVAQYVQSVRNQLFG